MKRMHFTAFSHKLSEESGRMILSFHTKYGKGSVVLAAGTGDHVAVRRIGDSVYVLALNRRLPYVGLEVFELRHLEPGDTTEISADVFMQEGACEESLGVGWEDRSDNELIGILEEYL